VEQGQLFNGRNLSRQFDPPTHVVEGAKRYAQERGLNWSDEGLGDVHVDHQRAYATAKAYERGLTAPEDTTVRSSYEAMRQHVNEQYDFMTRPREHGGLGIQHEVTPEDPYPDVKGVAEDVAQGRIKTFATASTGKHEFFSDEENDKFRAVHDVFGHIAIGRGFNASGEDAAYQSHAQMFPKEAHAALASETRGQNSYLNYGPTGDFASQEGKLIRVPEWVHGELPPPEPVVSRKQFTDQRLF
jgi:hypothetical protein